MLINERTGEIVARAIEVANTRETRRRGLLGRDGLEPSSALVIMPCFSIHTAFMRFPIDAVFVSRDGCAVKVVRDLAPWRMTAALGAHAVIEMAAGELRTHDVRVGDRLYLAAAGNADVCARSASSSGFDISLRSTASKPACSGS